MKITKKELKRKEKRLLAKQWQQVRQLVLERDGHKCVLCGSVERLNVHHILPKEFLAYRYLQFDIRNLITCCPKCHKYGNKSFHKCPLYALNVFKTMYPENYDFLMSQFEPERFFDETD
jgi:hypothetical protein